MSTKDLVSIGMPTYNGASRIRGALDSLLAQSYKNFELIISDNASDDGTTDICKQYAKNDSRIRYIRQDKLIHGGRNFMFVASAAIGKYFMWAADDDWWDTKFIEKLKEILDNNLSYGVAMCSFKRGNGEYKFIGDSGKIRDLTNLDSFKLFYRLVSASGYARDNHMIYGLFRREFLQTFFYRTMFPLCTRPEMVILAEMALLTRFYTIPDVLFHKYRPKLKRRDTQHKYFIWYMMIMFVRIWTSKRVHAVQKFRVLVFCPILLYETRKFIWKDLRHIKNIFISILSFKMVL